MEKVVDATMPDGKWTFDGEVTTAFDDMLSRSIPQYELMRDLTLTLGLKFVRPRTDVVDLGCSRGEALDPFVKTLDIQNHFVGIEVSEPMLAAARERFADYIQNSMVDIRKLDLRTSYPVVNASLTLAVLTMQFVPIEYRQRVIQNVYDHTVAGGAFIVVEKVLGETAAFDRLFVDRYYQMKSLNGYSPDAIDRKRLSLEGVLVPVTASWNVELLRQAGFRQIDCFWRWCNFAGWIAVK